MGSSGTTFLNFLRTGTRAASRAALDLIYPPLCIGCHARLSNSQPICLRCTTELERADLDQINAQLTTFPRSIARLESVFSLWVFDKGGPLQRVQHGLKYQNLPSLGVALGRLMGSAYRKEMRHDVDLIVPVPLARVRYYERGYNQSAMLALGMADAMNVDVSQDLLRRARPTRTQTRLTQDQRWQNVAGSFAVDESKETNGRSLLVVDDVLTTGATLLAAAQPLLEAGAASVHAATLCFART